MKLLTGKNLFAVAIVLGALVVLAILMSRGKALPSTKSVWPPAEKDRTSAVMVRENDLFQKTRGSQGPARVTPVAGVAPISVPLVPKIIKPAKLAIVATSVKSSAAASKGPFKIYR